MKCDMYAAMRRGPRDRQEDCIIDGGKVRQEDSAECKNAFSVHQLLLAVCDGMGGHRAGETASRFVCEQLAQRNTDQIINGGSIHEEIARIQRLSEENLPADSGTTVAGVWISDQLAFAFNAGDSRVYGFGESGLRYISHDHSLVQEWVDNSLIPEATVFGHPYRHLIEFGIGPVFKDNWDGDRIHVHQEPLQESACYLICSDGLNDVLQDEEIFDILMPSPVKNGKKLLKEVSRKGLKDNTSFIIAEIRP